MTLKKLIKVNLLLLCMFSIKESVQAMQTAIESDEEEIILLSRLIKQSQGIARASKETIAVPLTTVEFLGGDPNNNGRAKAGTIYKKNNKIFVVFNDRSKENPIKYSLSHLNLNSYKRVLIQPTNQISQASIKGFVYKELNDEYLHSRQSFLEKLKEITNDSSSGSLSLIFSGYGRGGSLATLAAAHNVELALGKNKVQPKLITFYPDVVGNADFSKSLEKCLGMENILRFSNYFQLSEIHPYLTNNSHPGIGVYFTPTEELRNHFAYPENIRKFISLGIISWLFYSSSVLTPEDSSGFLSSKTEILSSSSNGITGPTLDPGDFHETSSSFTISSFSPKSPVFWKNSLYGFLTLLHLIPSQYLMTEENLKSAIRFYKAEYDIVDDKENKEEVKNIGKVNILSIYRNSIIRFFTKFLDR